MNYIDFPLPSASFVVSDGKGFPLPSINRKSDRHVATKTRFEKRQIGDFPPKQKCSKLRNLSSLLVIVLLAIVVDIAVALKFNPETDCFDFSLDLSSAIPVQFGSPTYEPAQSLSHPALTKNSNSSRGLIAQTMGKKKVKKHPKSLFEYEKVSNLKYTFHCYLQ